MRAEVGANLVNVIARVLVMATIVPGAREAHQETDTTHGLVRGGPTAGLEDITVLTVVLAVVLIAVILAAQCMKMLTLLPIHLSGPLRLK